MGINECSKPASKSSWDSQDFGDVNMVLKMVHFRKSSRPQWVKEWMSGYILCFNTFSFGQIIIIPDINILLAFVFAMFIVSWLRWTVSVMV